MLYLSMQHHINESIKDRHNCCWIYNLTSAVARRGPRLEMVFYYMSRCTKLILIRLPPNPHYEAQTEYTVDSVFPRVTPYPCYPTTAVSR